MTEISTTAKAERLPYHHTRSYQKACTCCGGTSWRHAGFLGRMRVRIWKCIGCGLTEKLAASHIEALDDSGIGRLVKIDTLQFVGLRLDAAAAV